LKLKLCEGKKHSRGKKYLNERKINIFEMILNYFWPQYEKKQETNIGINLNGGIRTRQQFLVCIYDTIYLRLAQI
jgi:hypothetical protein